MDIVPSLRCPLCRAAGWLAGAALAAGLAGCGRQTPQPPASTPRPTTMTMAGGELHTADMQLHKRPVPPAPGPM